MKQWISVLFPQKIKYRFFVSFLLFILMPAAAIVFYYFHELESSLKDKISSQNVAQLGYIKESMENIRSALFKESLVLSRDRILHATLQDNSGDSETRGLAVTGHLLGNRLEDEASLFSVYIYYTLIDHRHREVHTTWGSTIAYADIIKEDWWRKSEGVGQMDKKADPTTGTKLSDMYTFTSELSGPDGKPDGHLLISFDYRGWLNAMSRFFMIRQDFFMMDRAGNMIIQNRNASLSDQGAEVVRKLADSGGYWTDGTELMNAVYLPSYHWYLVNNFPLYTFFGDIDQAKQRLFVVLVLFSLLFVVITFVISHRITRPLQLLQHQMSGIVKNQFMSALPEMRGLGEVRELGATFNRMIDDIRSLIYMLKVEEREKEASRFQMLLAQMNPHFLLNTLNAIKWTALERHESEIADICVSLGELLESSLNVQTDLIHLHEELALVRAYVRIQNFRFDSKVVVSYDYDESLRYALVPKLSLQPLVENSFYHGFSQMEQEGRIAIRVYTENESLLMEVEDNGIGLQESSKMTPRRKSKGIGIGNLRERLKLLYKSEGQLETISPDQGTLIRLKIPLLLSEPYEKGE